MQKKMLLRIAVLAILVVFILLNWNEIRNLNIIDFINNWENIYVTIGIVLSLFAFKSVFFLLPLPMIYISSGMVLPLSIAILVNILGVAIEISLTYLYGKLLGSDYIDKIICKSKKLQRGLEINHQNEFLITFILRLTPVGIEMVSLMLGASGNYYQRYILASLLGLVPKLVIFTIIGHSMVNPISFTTVLLFAIAICTWGFLIIQVKKRDLVSGIRW